MQLRFLASLVIFLGSYLPLALILLTQDINYTMLRGNPCWTFWQPTSACAIPLYHPKFSLLILLICSTCFALTLLALRVCQPKRPIDISEVKYIPAELMSYTLPYVVAFMSIGYQETGKFVGLSIFLGWMFWITHKSGQIILNPVLTVFDWRLYEVKYTFPGDALTRVGQVLAKGGVEPGHRYGHDTVQDILVIRPAIPKVEE